MAMCTAGTPVTHHPDLGLFIKREDLCCPGGPNFSKTRGVYAHIAARPESVMGVLDTSHSQGGWAVARACALLGKRCVEFYPEFKSPGKTPNEVQRACAELGARVVPLPAGRSAILYHRARKILSETSDSYIVPNALKLPEMVTETAAEVARTTLPPVNTLLISASSGTIATGVILGLQRQHWGGLLVVHQGYSRSQDAMLGYMTGMTCGAGGWRPVRLGTPFTPGEPLPMPPAVEFVDEGYGYADRARPCGVEPPCPMNAYYDLKTFSWWVREGRSRYGEALMWNVG